jgi:plasmid stabilization system protein ParE
MAHRVAPRAAADLDDIWFYVANESSSVRVANRLIDSITRRFFQLARHPYLARARDDDFGPGSRSFPVGEYVIVYCMTIKTCSSFALCMGGAILKRCSGASVARLTPQRC